jgi:hypothetical protein
MKTLLDITKFGKGVLFRNNFIFFSAIKQLSKHFIVVRLPKKEDPKIIKNPMEYRHETAISTQGFAESV